MSVTSGDPMLGRLLDGRYRVEARIARGGMATVYTATDTRLDRSVAVKVMHTGLGSDEEFASRFVREARSAARLNHPSVVAVFDQGDDDGTVYLVMEYVEGQTLRAMLNHKAPMPPQSALAMLEQILIAVAAAHDAGLVHRDLKPENVLISEGGTVKVADFGLARAVNTTTAATATSGVLVGTVSYLAPELVLHQGADARSDVYACGVMLYEMLTGRKPHEGETPIQVAYKHVHDDVPPPSELVPDLPPYLDALVARTTARDRDLRPADAKVLLRQARRVRNALDQGLRDDPELTEDLLPRAPLSETTVEEPWLPPLFDDRPMPSDGPEHTLVVDPNAPPGPMEPTLPPGPPGQPLTARYGNDMTPEGETQKRKRRLGLIAVIVVVVLAIAAGIGGWYLGVGRFTTTPEITGLTLTEATEATDSAGLGIEVVSEEYSETVPPGMIISSDPDGGDRIQDGETVEVVVSKGKERYEVPDILGMPLEQATSRLTAANLVVGEVTEKHNGKYEEGTVAETSIDVESPVKPGTTVDLVISTGPVLIRIPDYTGQWAGRSIAALEEIGFDVDATREHSEEVAPNRIMSQEPAGVIGHKGDVITVVISGGPAAVPIPSVFGWELKDARRAMKDAGFKVDIVRADNYVGFRRVSAQDPAAGGTAPWGTTITLTIV